jgi:hypothetical protein
VFDKRSDAGCFVRSELHSAEPKKDNDQSPSKQGQEVESASVLFSDLKTNRVCKIGHLQSLFELNVPLTEMLSHRPSLAALAGLARWKLSMLGAVACV